VNNSTLRMNVESGSLLPKFNENCKFGS